jgi:hypothetical protein
MVNTGGFRVDPEELVAHAGNVAESAARLGRAADTGAMTHLGQGSYGTLCSFIPTMLDPFQSSVVQALRRCAETLDSTVDVLKQTADTYTAGETKATDVVAAAGRFLQDSSGTPGRVAYPRESLDVAARDPSEGMRLPGTEEHR